jgi:hypothetical protein
VTFRLKFALATRLVPAHPSARDFKRKRLLGSSLIVLVTSDRLHLGRRHYAVHKLGEFRHVVLARYVSTYDFSQSLTLDPNNGEHLEVRTFLNVNKSLQVSKKLEVRITYMMRLLYKSGFSLQHMVNTMDSSCCK